MTNLLPPMSEAMKAAYDELCRLGIKPVQKTRFQLKIGCVNFYPGKGTIIVDGELQKHVRSGFDALLDLLRERGLLKDRDRQATTVKIDI